MGSEGAKVVVGEVVTSEGGLPIIGGVAEGLLLEGGDRAGEVEVDDDSGAGAGGGGESGGEGKEEGFHKKEGGDSAGVA